MLINHAKLMQFFSVAREVVGRKKLQKMIYILQSCGLPFEEKYQFHVYGPYSEELSLRTEELCNLGFLSEEKEEKSNYFQYHYTITTDGERFLEQFDMKIASLEEKSAMILDKSARFLELVATMLYFKQLPREEVEKKVHIVKPKQNYNETELKEAWQLIDALMDA
ncbi:MULTISPECIES: YwgA family protein [unclassified Virgibacillus]|uniref:YwgA family protein n=1 Tax=unclassified Virgibacillus TaxID=2620237 RepID=UPI0024DEBAAA|nr:YwgA family protein [Virgibacillus sp. LDC-1]